MKKERTGTEINFSFAKTSEIKKEPSYLRMYDVPGFPAVTMEDRERYVRSKSFLSLHITDFLEEGLLTQKGGIRSSIASAMLIEDVPASLQVNLRVLVKPLFSEFFKCFRLAF